MALKATCRANKVVNASSSGMTFLRIVIPLWLRRRLKSAIARTRSPLCRYACPRYTRGDGGIFRSFAAAWMMRVQAALPHRCARMLLCVTTAVTTGEHGGSVRGRSQRRNRDQRGQCESGDKYFHDTSPYLDHCRLWHQRIGRSAGACRPKDANACAAGP
jgi:hypothetical protein